MRPRWSALCEQAFTISYQDSTKWTEKPSSGCGGRRCTTGWDTEVYTHMYCEQDRDTQRDEGDGVESKAMRG